MAGIAGARRPGRPARRGQARLALALGVVIALELLLRLASWGSERVALTLSPGVALTLPDARLGLRGNPAVPDHDPSGWRNALRPARASIVVIGDSQSYGAEVTREQAWPQRLGVHQREDSYNLALGGYGPVQYLRLLDDALALEPRLVLIGLYAGNDLADAYAAVHERGLADELLPESSVRERLAEAEAEWGALGSAWHATRAARRGRVRQALRLIGDPIEAHSRLFGLLRALGRALGPRAPAAAAAPSWKPWSHYAQQVAGLDPDLLLPVSDGRSGTILTPAARAAALDPRDPRIAEGLRISLAALEAAADRCVARCRVAVVAIPTKERVFEPIVNARLSEPPPALRRLVADESAFWSQLRDFLARRGIGFIDTLPALRATLAGGENPYPPDWNGHPNAVGNEAIALAVRRSAEAQP